MQVHGIGSHRVVYKEVVKVQSNYTLDLFKGRGKKGQCDLVCAAPLDDWANADLC